MLQTPRFLRQQTNGTYQSKKVWHGFSEKASNFLRHPGQKNRLAKKVQLRPKIGYP
jgi:hypothetical protein